MDKLEQFQHREVMKISRLDYLSRGEAERAGTVQSKEEMAQWELITVYKYVMGGHKEGGNSVLCCFFFFSGAQ